MSMTPEEQLEILIKGAINVVVAEELLAKLKEGRPLRIKYGADPSAPDLHLGHSVPLRKLKRFQELGHQVIFIIGDYTGRIGDPSGRTKTRPMLSEEEIKRNAATYVEQVGEILDVEEVEIVYNSQWFAEMNAADLLSLASHYTVARMLERDDFALRIDGGIPISILEMLYPLIQGYDSVAVEADVEIGGSDQLFNLLVGRDIMRAYGMTPQVVLTWPLLVGTDGQQKMSKSLGNYIGITEPPGEMFGKLMSIPDELMPQYHDLLLEPPGLFREDPSIDPAHIFAEIERRIQKEPRNFKADLAEAIVTRYHSAEAARKAREEFDLVFSSSSSSAYVSFSSSSSSSARELRISASELIDGRISIIDLIMRPEFAGSKAEARRLIRQGAVSINDAPVTDEMAQVKVATGDVLRVGKRRFAKLVVSE